MAEIPEVEPQDMGACPSCGGPTKFEGRCMACIMADYDDEDQDDDCWNCGGEGFVSNCFEEYACLYPEDGCHLCIRRCDVCRAQPQPSSGESNDG